MSHTGPIILLLADDSEDDVLMLRLALRSVDTPCDMRVVEDGDEVIPCLQKLENEPSTSVPNLIVLDINMPRMNGLEVLAFLKESALYKDIPVVMLSTSDRQEDIARSYRLGAAHYYVKPDNVDGYRDLARQLTARW